MIIKDASSLSGRRRCPERKRAANPAAKNPASAPVTGAVKSPGKSHPSAPFARHCWVANDKAAARELAQV